MSSESEPPAPAPPAPSVFISYASEDRTAARTLRDALIAAGLDVWYDENELGGGDAWDQKIRRQIRDCEYFMPIISATTEARKEGYFRREWRLATERSLDMADDVLFLIPVTIDDTREIGARVPDKFLTVQWLRTPGGNPTPALHHLIRRILSGNHQALTRPPMAMTRPAYAKTAAPFPPPISTEPPPLLGMEDEDSHSPPKMPPFPHVPEKGGFLHGIKFLAEVMWWAFTAAWMLFKRMPRWARVLVTIWLVLTLFSTRNCSVGDNRKNEADAKPTASHDDAKQAAKTAMDGFAQAAREARKNGKPEDLSKLGEQIAARFAQAATDVPGLNAGKRLVMVPFSKLASEDPGEKFGSAVFASLYGRLTLTHAREVGLFRQPPPGAGDSALATRAKQFGSSFVLTGHVTGEGDTRALTVRLLVAEDDSVKWTESYPLANAEPSDIADKIADKVIESLPPRREAPRQKPDKSDKQDGR